MIGLGPLGAIHGGALAMIAAVLAASAMGCARSFMGRPADTHRRGVIVRELTRMRRLRDRLGFAACRGLTLAGVSVAPLDETRHFKIIGATGSGKSTAIRELLGRALERGDRVVVADPDGGYCARFFDRRRGDVVLNPFEPESVRWDPFAEIRHSFDVEQLVSGLVAQSGDPSANEWRGYARTFLAALVRRCHERGAHDCAQLWRLAAIASAEELRPWVLGTPAQPFLDLDNARMFGSIRSVAVSAIAALEHVVPQRTAPFSVREWVSARERCGSLFLPYKAPQIAALRSMIATWMRLAIFEAMNGEENCDQRLWFVVDELDALGAIDGLKDALARLRKFGGRCVLGFQSIAQVSNTYGGGDGQTIVENCGNTLILRCSSSEHGGTPQFASRLIGEREIVRRHVTRGSDGEGLMMLRGARRSRNTSEQHVTEMAVMASEIEQLPDLTGYLKLASSKHWVKVSYPISHHRSR